MRTGSCTSKASRAFCVTENDGLSRAPFRSTGQEAASDLPTHTARTVHMRGFSLHTFETLYFYPFMPFAWKEIVTLVGRAPWLNLTFREGTFT